MNLPKRNDLDGAIEIFKKVQARDGMVSSQIVDVLLKLQDNPLLLLDALGKLDTHSTSITSTP